MTFARGLRSVLRQDPDIIMIGEIRDRETAVMAIQSALTGHLVFSTLHTNDAAGAVARLLDLGIEPYLLASSLVGVLAQRLVRRVCPECVPARAGAAELARLLPERRADVGRRASSRPTGCPACRQTGYRGRLGIFELLLVDDAVRRKIQATRDGRRDQRRRPRRRDGEPARRRRGEGAGGRDDGGRGAAGDDAGEL